MAIEFIQVDLTDNLGSPWNISQNKVAHYAGIQINNTVYTSKEKNYKFSSKKPSATKHSPPSNVYYMEFIAIFYLNIV